MKGLWADARHAFRLYRRTPAASVIAVVVLAVGMAFVGAFLSLYVDLMLRPNPGFEESGRIITVGQIDGTRFTGVPIGLIDRIADEVPAFEAIAGVETTFQQVGEDGESVSIEVVTREFFEGIRPKLTLGRGFLRTEHEVDGDPVVVISDRYWREEFDASPDVIGATIDFPPPNNQRTRVVNGQLVVEEDETEEGPTAFRVVGVMAPEMPGVMSDEIALWVTLERILPYVIGTTDYSQVRSSLSMRSLARLAPGASAAAAASELRSRYPESTENYRLQPGFRLDAVKGIVRNINVHRDAQRQLQLFLAGSVLLALVAAANVSLFLLARAPGRRRELAIRMSVGAPVRRLARQLASESGLLVVLSALLGLLVSVWLVSFLRGLAFLRQAEWSNVTLLDWRVLGLVSAFLLILTLLVSLAPILGLKRLGIAASSRQVAARATLAQRVAGTTQIAIAGTLGGAAVAFGWFLGSMTLGYPGFETEDRYVVNFSPIFSSQSSNGAANFLQSSNIDTERQREVIEAIPGVNGITFTTLIPSTSAMIGTRTVADPDDPTQQLSIGNGSIDSRYVDVLGVRLLYGRAPAADENGVALVNEALARRFFGRENVVGETLEIPNTAGPTTEVVGVLEDLSYTHPSADVEPILFTRLPPSPFGMRGVIDSQLPAAELQRQLQELIDAGELELGQPNVQPLTDMRKNLIAPDTARSLLTIGTAGLVVLLAAFGFYGTQRYLVLAGRREYAIRASLGAGPTALGQLVFLRGLLLSLPGLVVGALLAFTLVAWLREDFVSRDISPGLVTLAVVCGLVVLLTIASLGPARHAQRTEPAPLLRED